MDATPSRLEMAILGVVARTQPCSGYSVRRTFADSLTGTWQSNSGAIYPGIGRLVDRGLIRRSAEVADRRGTRSLQLTRAGRAVLRRWLLARPAAGEIVPEDPLRLRLIFIASLAPDDRARALAVLTDAVAAESERFRRAAETSPDPLDEITFKAVLIQLDAQREAIELMRRRADEPAIAGDHEGNRTEGNRP